MRLYLSCLPIKNVEESVESEERDVVRCQVLYYPHFVQHHNLRHKGYRLQPQGETPWELPRCEPSVKDAGQQEGNWDEDLPVGELVAKSVISGAEGQLVSHQVDDSSSWRDEEDLHAGVVHAHKVHEEIHVAHTEHQQVHFLRLAWDT